MGDNGHKSPTRACSDVGLDADPAVYRVLWTLLTVKIFFRRLDRNVAEQELDLVEFPSGIAALVGAGAAEIMRGEVFNGCSSGAVLCSVPRDPLCSPLPHVLPARQTHRNTRPSLTPADASHRLAGRGMKKGVASAAKTA